MYLDDLKVVVRRHRAEIESSLELAVADLERLRGQLQAGESRVQGLRALIAIAGEERVGEPQRKKLTLHEAMACVLSDAPGGEMRAGDLAEAIRRRDLYRMRDGRPVEAQQIHARVGMYPHLFGKNGTSIRLRPKTRPTDNSIEASAAAR